MTVDSRLLNPARDQVLAAVTASGRGAEIWARLRQDVDEAEKQALIAELNGLVTAEFQRRSEEWLRLRGGGVNKGRQEVKLLKAAFKAGAFSREMVSIVKGAAQRTRRPDETPEAALDRFFEEHPETWDIVRTVERAESMGPAKAARLSRLRKQFNNGGGPVYEALEKAALELRRADPLLSRAQAIDRVLQDDPALRELVYAADRGEIDVEDVTP